MANLVETVDVKPGNLDDLTKSLSEDVAVESAAQSAARTQQRQQADTENTEEQVVDPELPEKFRGKSKAEIAEAYKNLESQVGRMANDLGTQRQLTDRILNLKRESDLENNGASKVVELPKVKSSELLEDPTATIDSIVSARLKQREDTEARTAQETQAQLAAQQFATRHPDYQQYVDEPKFVDWIKASPTRSRLAGMAAHGAWDIADDLLTEYKAVKSQAGKKVDEVVDSNLDKARQVSLESGSQAAVQSGKGKVYRRADLLRLKAERPDEYYNDDFQAIILKAYAEKRVK